MKNNCIKFFVALLVVGLAFASIAANAEAASNDSLTVKVTILTSISVSIVENELNFGAVTAGSTTVSTGSVSIINDGSGINETYSLSLTDPSGWTSSQAAPDMDTYVLNSAFSSIAAGITWDVVDHALSDTPVVCSATKFAGNQTGVNVGFNAARNLWFQFMAPIGTSITTEQDIVVTVTAQAAE